MLEQLPDPATWKGESFSAVKVWFPRQGNVPRCIKSSKSEGNCATFYGKAPIGFGSAAESKMLCPNETREI